MPYVYMSFPVRFDQRLSTAFFGIKAVMRPSYGYPVSPTIHYRGMDCREGFGFPIVCDYVDTVRIQIPSQLSRPERMVPAEVDPNNPSPMLGDLERLDHDLFIRYIENNPSSRQ